MCSKAPADLPVRDCVVTYLTLWNLIITFQRGGKSLINCTISSCCYSFTAELSPNPAAFPHSRTHTHTLTHTRALEQIPHWRKTWLIRHYQSESQSSVGLWHCWHSCTKRSKMYQLYHRHAPLPGLIYLRVRSNNTHVWRRRVVCITEDKESGQRGFLFHCPGLENK